MISMAYRKGQVAAATALFVMAIGATQGLRASYVDAVEGANPKNYWRLEEQAGDAQDLGSNPVTGAYGTAVQRSAAGPRPADGYRAFGLNNTAAGFDPASTSDPNSTVDMGNYAPVTGGNPRTILAWINLDVVAAAKNQAITYYGAENSNERFRFEVFGDELSCDVNGSRLTGGDTTLEPGQWYFVGVVVPNIPTPAIEDVQLFVDGMQEMSQGPGTIVRSGNINTGSSADFNVGRHPGKSFNVEGTVDEVVVFDRALSSSEILGLYNAAIPEPGTLGLFAAAALAALTRRRR